MEFYISDDGRLTDFRTDTVAGKIVIPQGVKVIGWQAFANLPALTRVLIPDSVEIIEEQAFLGCEQLHDVIIPDSVRCIGLGAFANCSNLKVVSIPETVTDIRPYAFHSVFFQCGYERRDGNFCIYGKRGSAAESFADEYFFYFKEIETDGESLLTGEGIYSKPDLTPERDGNTVVICIDEDYTWGITADGYPYERYQNTNNPHDLFNYFMPVPWTDLYSRLDELSCICRWNGFPDWAEEFGKTKKMLERWQKTGSEQTAPVVSVEEMRNADRATIERGTPGRELMRRAAQGVFDAYGEWNAKDVAIFCGSGNNGGDGYALAEILDDHGVPVTIVRVSDKLSEDGAYYYNRCMEKGISVLNPEEDWIDFFRYDIYVDCLLGTGFRGTPREPVAAFIRKINESRKRYDERFVISVDINSGMNGDTGEAELAIESNLTVSIGAFKKGLLKPHGRELIGKLVNVDIGIEIPVKNPGD